MKCSDLHNIVMFDIKISELHRKVMLPTTIPLGWGQVRVRVGVGIKFENCSARNCIKCSAYHHNG